MVSFTENALKVLRESVESPDLIRLAVIGGGCSGFMYDMEIESEASEEDIVLEFDNLKNMYESAKFFYAVRNYC